MIEQKKKVRESFNTSASEYHLKYYKEYSGQYTSHLFRQEYILEMLEGNTGNVLDIGCGSGELILDLLRRGFKVWGVDVSYKMIEKSKGMIMETKLKHQVQLSVADVENLPFSNESFDVITCAGVIEYLETDKMALKEIYRVLKPQGIAIMDVRNLICPFRFLETLGFRRFVIWLALLLKKADSKINYVDRRHVPWQFNKTLSKHGLKKADHAYFAFYPLPYPFHHLFPSFARYIGRKMERLSKSPIGWLGAGYIVKVIKRGRING